MTVDPKRWDASSFGAFSTSIPRELLVFFASRTCDPEAAMDLTAETFAQAFADRAAFRGSSDGEAAAWLFGIARHQLTRFFARAAPNDAPSSASVSEYPTSPTRTTHASNGSPDSPSCARSSPKRSQVSRTISARRCDCEWSRSFRTRSWRNGLPFLSRLPGCASHADYRGRWPRHSNARRFPGSRCHDRKRVQPGGSARGTPRRRTRAITNRESAIDRRSRAWRKRLAPAFLAIVVLGVVAVGVVLGSGSVQPSAAQELERVAEIAGRGVSPPQAAAGRILVHAVGQHYALAGSPARNAPALHRADAEGRHETSGTALAGLARMHDIPLADPRS